jgi:D-alanine-D-alanine ligase
VRGTYRGKKVGVLVGGLSAERDVSLNTGKGVHAALVERGYDAVALDWTQGTDLQALLRGAGVDVVWNALHGTYGEDGAVQGFLEILRLPYTGSGVLASAVAMDKVLSKRAFDHAGLGTAPWKLVAPDADGAAVRAAAASFGYPVVVKPSREGSSVGVTIVHGEGELDAAIALARRHHGETMVEKYIPGQEVDIAVLGGEVLGTVEIKPAKEFYDYEAKYLRHDTTYLVPAPLPPAADAEVRRVALAAYHLLGCSGYARVDARLPADGGVYLLEVNTLPGMTATSLLPKIAKHAGISYAEVVERVLDDATLHL